MGNTKNRPRRRGRSRVAGGSKMLMIKKYSRSAESKILFARVSKRKIIKRLADTTVSTAFPAFSGSGNKLLLLVQALQRVYAEKNIKL